MIFAFFLGELAPADRTYHSCSGLLQPASRIEASYIADYFGHLLARCALALDPWMGHDAVGVEASRRLNYEQAAD